MSLSAGDLDLPDAPLLADLEAIAVDVARSAGRLVVDERPDAVEVASTKSTTTDVVTVMDQRSQDHLLARLREARPDDAVLGEESGGASGTSGITWVIDPIDGTVNYLYGIRQYAVSIAVVEGDPDPHTWRALAGVVVNPASGEVFAASAGGVATLDGATIAVAPPVELSQALVGTGFGYRAEIRVEQAKALAGLIGRVRDIRRQGSAALDLCAVACGRLNAYFERGLNPWDHAAGSLIAAEAGARVTLSPGDGRARALILAAEPEVAAMLEGLLLELGA